jgi:thiaminase/transcriptional activator TenA
MSWSKSAWEKAQPIYDQIVIMPFIKGMIEGTLHREKFNFYIAQDARYLENFGRALAMIAARAHRKDHVLDFIRFAEGAIVVESALHAGYLGGQEGEKKIEVSPACHHYNSHLISMATLESVEVAMAAVLPCFWVYKEVGDYIFQHQKKEGNPYQEWINTYSGNDFGIVVNKAIQICDEVATTCTPAQREAMTDAFLTGCQLEWMFWDSAWRLERWPVAAVK